jgi:hypothetical protein
VIPACQAAVDVGRERGVSADDPLLVQETNNTIVWLRPHPVIAKVGTRADRAEALVREHELARALVALDAPVAAPLVGSLPARHPPTGYTVTLWDRLDHDADARPSGPVVANSLRRLHGALARSETELPDFRLGLQRARDALSEAYRFPALGPSDITLLRETFDGLLPELDSRELRRGPLHGEPHDANRLVTPLGIRWVDFESACHGPIEWDLAFLPDDARETFTQVDQDLLALLSTLNSARVATWCWLQARFPEMRWHGQHHLDTVRKIRSQ